MYGYAMAMPTKCRRNKSARSINDAATRQIVRGDFDFDSIPWDDANEILPHTAGNVRDDFASEVEFNAELRVGKRFLDAALDFNCFFLGHVRSSRCL